MTFAYQILSMTNYCNLRCKYCDWNKTGGFPLSPEQLKRAEEHIRWSREFADGHFGDFLMGVYSGGEPFVFPELVELFLKEYKDKWVRISTNGLFDPKRCLPMLSRHKKLILTASLDGIDLESNQARFTSEKQLDLVLQNIQEALDRGILVMILCTINKFNIDYFFEFADALYDRFGYYVDAGRLVMPAHYITAYTSPVGIPHITQEERFLKRLEKKLPENPVLSNVAWHYRALGDYVRTKSSSGCRVSEWSRCAHFLGDNMVGEGKVNTYLCPMRGYGDLGEFDREELSGDYDRLYVQKHEAVYGKTRDCRCFVDWIAFDRVLRGEVSLEQAAKWFAFFRDPQVKRWITDFQMNHHNP